TSRTSCAIARTVRTRARHGRGLTGMTLTASERRQDLGADQLELVALLGRVADRVQQEVGAAGGAESLELLQALLGRADDAVFRRERAEVLGVARGQPPDPPLAGGLVVAADRDERQVRGDEIVE